MVSTTASADSQTPRPLDDAAVEAEILLLSERLPLQFRLVHLVVCVALNTCVVAAFADRVPAWQLGLWWALSLTAVVLTSVWLGAPVDLGTPRGPVRLRRRHLVRVAVLTGAHGSSGLLLFTSGDLGYQMMLALMATGMTLGFSPFVSQHRTALRMATVLLMAPTFTMLVISPATGAARVAGMVGLGAMFMICGYLGQRCDEFEELIRRRLDEQRLREQATAGLRASELLQAERLHFFSAANHDLRQPVTAIGLQAEVLRQQLARQVEAEPGADADARANLDAMTQTVAALAQAQQTLEALVDQLLDVSRIEARADPLRMGAVALAPLLDVVATQARSARLHVRCPPGAAVLGDALTLQRMLANLCDNALKFAPKGRVLLAVRRGRWTNGSGIREDAWRIEVRDAGPGIAAEAQTRVFSDFVQLGNPQRDVRAGQGLGLAIVRRLAERMGTRVTVHSSPGRGAVFGFTLPAAPMPQAAPSAVAAHPSGAIAAARPMPAVLVVEDDPLVAQGLAAMLQEWGARPRLYENAAAALALADLRAIDVAVCDRRLPGSIDGVALARRLQQLRPGMGIVLLSADVDEALQQLASQQGWMAVRKPVRAEDLLAAMAAVHPRRGPDTELRGTA